MKNKSNNSTTTKTKKKLLPPIKSVKKEPITLKISNKKEATIEKKSNETKIPSVHKAPEKDLTLNSDNRQKRLSSLPIVTIKPDVAPVNILEKQKTTLNANGGNFNPDSAYQLDKRQRFEIYKRRLLIKPPASTSDEAVLVINKTLDEIEDKYAPKKDDKFYALNSKKYGRMW
jgi:hypothetical protein